MGRLTVTAEAELNWCTNTVYTLTGGMLSGLALTFVHL